MHFALLLPRRSLGTVLVLAATVGLAGCGGAALGGLLPGSNVSVGVQQHGAVAVYFQSAPQTQAVRADIKSLRVGLSGSALATPQTKTVTYPPAAPVSFVDLKAGLIDLKIEALDAQGAVIGTATKPGVEILLGQLTSVTVTLKLVPTTVTPGHGNIGVGIVIDDGDIVTAPLPSPTPAPLPSATPTPAPTTTPAPTGSLTGDWYVDAKVATSGSGTSASPFKTVAAAIARATAGQTIVVRSGTYRETLVIPRALKLLGEPGAIIKGSDVWSSGWTQEGSVWSHAYSYSWAQSGDGSARSKLADQIFVDGVPQYQETSQGAVVAGKFFVGNGKIYLGTNPSGRTVEVTARERWVYGSNGASNVTVKGFTMQHGAIQSQRGGLWDAGGANWLVEGNDLSYAHGAGVQFNGNGGILRNNKIHHNGQIGIVTSQDGSQAPSNQLVEGNEIAYNNTEAFNAGWEAGGTKFSRTTGLVVRNNHVHDNGGTGLWFDIDVRTTTISGNRVHHNQDRGISYEISYDALIEGNYVWENGYGYATWVWGAGILVQNSPGCEVRNNVVAWNADGIGVVQQDRGTWTAVTNTNVHHNTVAVKNGTLLGWMSDLASPTLFASGSNNRGSSNQYYNAGGSSWEWQGYKGTLADFNATPGEEGGTAISSSALTALLTQAGMPTSPSR